MAKPASLKPPAQADDRPERFLPYGRQAIDEADIAAVGDVLRSDYLTTGPATRAFEAAFAQQVGAPHAVAAANGTAALYVAGKVLGIAPGDAVIVPSVTFVASANAFALLGARIVFADVEADTGLLSAQTVDAALTRARRAGLAVKAVVPVHFAGQVAEPENVAALARREGLFVIEDACHAVGTRYGEDLEHRVGACRHADMTCFSFHPVKSLAMGEGGAITTRDAQKAEQLARQVNHALDRSPTDFPEAFETDGTPAPWVYAAPEPGFNFRPSDIHCALGLSQLKKLDRFAAARRAHLRLYEDLLAELTPSVRMVRRLPHQEPSWHLCVALIDFKALGVNRAVVMARMKEAGIGTQVHYLPVHRQPYYRALDPDQTLPGADAFYARCLSLPLWPGLRESEIRYVVRILRESLGMA